MMENNPIVIGTDKTDFKKEYTIIAISKATQFLTLYEGQIDFSSVDEVGDIIEIHVTDRTNNEPVGILKAISKVDGTELYQEIITFIKEYDGTEG